MIIEGYVTLVLLHRPDGEVVSINPRHVTAITPAHDHGHFAKGVHCLIHTVDRKFLSVREQCSEVNQRMQNDLHPPALSEGAASPDRPGRP